MKKEEDQIFKNQLKAIARIKRKGTVLFQRMPATAANNRPKAKDILEMLRASFGLERYVQLCPLGGLKYEKANNRD